MAALIIHADFDHDGRISKKATEQDLRQESPGLIILPNIDADGKKWAVRIKKRSAVMLDYRRSKSGFDRELAELMVEVTDATASRLSFTFIGPTAGRFAVFDRKFKKLSQIGTQFDAAISSPGSYKFLIEASSLPGTPLVPQEEEEAPLHLAVNATLFDPDGAELAAEQLFVSVAPVIFIDNSQPAERLYICDIPEKDATDRGNLPSVTEVQKIINKIKGVHFVLIPSEINNRDAWIQDQFQTGYCQSASGIIRVIVHLPRLRSNVVQSEFQSNLATFPPEHFPSTNLGIFQDFYKREVGFGTDKEGNVRKITFMKSYELSLLFIRVTEVWQLIQRLYPLHRTKRTRDAALEKLLFRLPFMSFYETRLWLKTAVGIMKKLLSRRQLDPSLEEGNKERLALEEKNLSRRFGLVEKTVILDLAKNTGKLTVTTETFGDIIFTKSQIDKLNEKLSIVHSSLNYGGNLEVSGPVKCAPLGKVVLGTHKDADPDLLYFLKRQKVQPLVDIDTSWLDVAHTDEVMAFLPLPNSENPSFVMGIASPKLAMEIIDEAWIAHAEAGGTTAMTATPASGIDLPILERDTTTDGDAPLTRMLRGRYWLHHNPKEVFEEQRPPQTYMDMLDHYQTKVNPQSNIGVVEYSPEPGPDRYYEAAMSIREFRYFGRYTNDWLGADDHQQDRLQKTLRKEFPGVPQITIPVLYDEVRWKTDPKHGDMPDFENHQTSAFLPNGVNIQIVNDQLLIPRPFGPRAAPETAAHILKKIIPPALHGNLNPLYFSRKKLDKVYHWIKRPLMPGSKGSDLHRLTDQFKDGFPDLEDEEIRALILKANRTQFNAQPNYSEDDYDLTAGWHKLLIPENTVDLFEACIWIKLEAIGLKVHFIDSWYYHIRLGEIHCGTNVLRKVPQYKTKWWKHTRLSRISHK